MGWNRHSDQFIIHFVKYFFEENVEIASGMVYFISDTMLHFSNELKLSLFRDISTQ